MSANISQSVFLADELATSEAAQQFAQAIAQYWQATSGKPLMIYLKGDLGAGKSFFSRAFIQYFLPGQKVKSPTYTLVETYHCEAFEVHHFDLYRLCEPEELEYLGIRDLLHHASIALVEWPSKALGVLPKADIEIELVHLEQGRTLHLDFKTETAQSVADHVKLA